MNRFRSVPSRILLALYLAAGSAFGDPRPQPRGIVVEEAGESFAAYHAGLRPGDVLLHWRRAASPPANPESAAGGFDSPFDLDEVVLEQAPRGEVALSGTRGGERLEVRLPSGEWALRARPRFAAETLAVYDQAKKLIDEGLAVWEAMASDFAGTGQHLEASWLFLEVARGAVGNRDWNLAERAYEAARRQAEILGEASVSAWIAGSLADSLQERSEFERAAAAYRRALDVRQASAAVSLGTASCLRNLGSVAFHRGDLTSAEDLYRRALAMRQQLAPQSLDVAQSLNDLGPVAANRGDLAAAEDYFRRALALRERLAPQSLDVASSLNNLSIVAFFRGDLAAAEDYQRRSLTVTERLAPESLDIAGSLNNLGMLASEHGDLATAEAYYHRSLAIKEKLAPASLGVAMSFNNLGLVASERGDSAKAEEFHRRSLAINEKLAPESLHVAVNLTNLATVYVDRKDLAKAEEYLESALLMLEKQAPRSIETASALRRLGDVALTRSDLDTAEARYERALAIRRQRAPASAAEAEVCQRLGVLHRRRNRPDQALDFYRCAIEALDAQKGKLGGSDEVRTGFGAKVAGTYREAIDLLVETGDEEEAFHMLERYRARELLTLLAGRDLVFSADLPQELESRRRAANRSYDRAFAQWMRLSEPADAGARRKAREELEQAHRRQDDVRAEIRAAAPRLAQLQHPEPLGLDATRAALDPGTLLLSYSIGEDKSYLFAVGPEPGTFLAASIDIGEGALRAEIERFRDTVRRGRVDRRPGKVLLQARRLSERLLAPPADPIGRAERLLILADGPLHSLPFAALTDPGTIDGRHFLVEAKPIHHAASATVFGLLKQERRERRATRLTAFGDPLYPAAAPPEKEAEPQLRAALRGGFELTPLPATRTEVESLRMLFPQDSKVYLGAEATEERAKAVGRDTTLLHIASHGLLDDRFPLDSGLAFSIPSNWEEGDDNGLLQAWEIFEELRIDAELVTLSACGTGLGKILDGEGLLGLTRAFQYAGARSVLASLWNVSDASTGELMERFYGYLQKGESKVDALRSAQLDLLRGSAFRHPFHWAGFELVGDWR